MKIDLTGVEIEKGTHLSNSTVADLTGIKTSRYPDFQLAKLQLKQEIERHLKEQGIVAVVRATTEGVRVLTDNEALPYTVKRDRRLRKSLGRNLVKTQHIDTDNLTESEQREHGTAVRVMTARYSAMREVTSPLELVRPAKVCR